MDKQTYDTLYNKTIKDITESDMHTYKKAIEIHNLRNLPNKFLPFIDGMALAVVIFSGIGILSSVLTIAVACWATVSLNIIAKDVCELKFKNNVGISYQEYKDFKKSGGIKRIKNIIKQYKQNPYLAEKINAMPSNLTVKDFERKTRQNQLSKISQSVQCECRTPLQSDETDLSK